MSDQTGKYVEYFEDGNMAQVVRRGDSVVRECSLWSDAAHQVLNHLEDQSYSYAPRLKHATETTETLTYIAGRSLLVDLTGSEDEALLIQVGYAIRELHEAMAGFRFEPGTRYVPMLHGPEAPNIVCHNDIGPWNVIAHEGKLTGIIDWDLVAPGTPEWELAYAAWRFAPLYPEGRTSFSPRQQALRVVILLDAYGLPSFRRSDFVNLLLRRMRSAVDTVDFLGRQRVPGFSALYDGGLHMSGHDDRAWVMSHSGEMSRIIEK